MPHRGTPSSGNAGTVLLSPDIALRLASDADKAGIYALYKTAMQGYIDQIWGWDEAWQRNDFDMAYRTADTRVVEVDSAFAGYIQTEPTNSSLYIRMIILGDDYRSKGVGRILVDAVCRVAFEHGLPVELRVFRKNALAVKFYESNGFVIKAVEPHFYLMEKDVGR